MFVIHVYIIIQKIPILHNLIMCSMMCVTTIALVVRHTLMILVMLLILMG